MSNINAEKRQIKDLLSDINRGCIRVPEFQRDFVWGANDTILLLSTIAKNYPAGDLLLLNYMVTPETRLATRFIDGVKEDGAQDIRYVVLDGQQRLTSIYHALYGKGKFLFFIDLNYLKSNPSDIDNAILKINKNSRKAEWYQLEDNQFSEFIFPFTKILDNQFTDWRDDCLDFWNKKGISSEKIIRLKDWLKSINNTWIDTISDYFFPVVILSDTPLDAVAQIFENLNKTGIRLTVFELMTARLWPKINLKDLWEETQEENDIFIKFNINPVTILQTLSLIRDPASPSMTKKTILSINELNFKEQWKKAAEGLKRLLTIYQHECGVINKKWLPYESGLPAPAAALGMLIKKAKGAKIGVINEKLKRWFWATSFGELFDEGTERQNSKEFKSLTEWFQGGKEPESVDKFQLDKNRLEQVDNIRSAIYRSIICLIAKEARDFYSVQRITTDLVIDESIDDHHIFPKDYLLNKGIFSETEINNIINKTLIDAKTNRSISKQSPSKYLNDLQNKHHFTKFKEIAKTHFLNIGSNSGLMKNDYKKFLEERQKLIFEEINKVTGEK